MAYDFVCHDGASRYRRFCRPALHQCAIVRLLNDVSAINSKVVVAAGVDAAIGARRFDGPA